MREDVIIKLSRLLESRDRYLNQFKKLSKISRGTFSDREVKEVSQSLRWGYNNGTVFSEFEIEKEDIQELAWSILSRVEPRITEIEKEINLIKADIC